MKSKLFSLIAFSIFASVFLVGLASATVPILIESSSPNTLTKFSNSTTFVIDSTNVKADFTIPSSLIITDRYSHDITLTISSTETDSSSSTSVSITATLPSDVGDYFGDYSGILTVQAVEEGGTDTNSTNVTLSFTGLFCDYENPANLDVRIDSIDVKEGFGDDEDYWYPLDEVEIDVDIESPDYDVKNIEIEFCLYDITEDKCILDEGDIDISDDDFDLDENDDITTTLSFKVDPDALYAGNNDYIIYIKATGEIDDKSSTDDGEYTCASDSDGIDEIRTDEKFVILDNVEIPEIVSCGETVELTADVWNVGDEDMDDDEIFLEIYNYELGINKVIEFAKGIDSMDYEGISFSFDIPEDAKEKTYTILITAYDDEDMADKHIYENREDDKAEYKIFMAISDCAVEPEVSVSATLESAARAGKVMEIKITLENTGSDTRTFIVAVENYGAWAELSETPDTLIINSGNSKETYAKLNVNKDASGEKTFDILIYEGTELIKTQPVSVNIEPRNFLGITGLSIEGNEYLWGLGILNVILVIVIIIVAVRVARRK